jgi:hypothetical protein
MNLHWEEKSNECYVAWHGPWKFTVVIKATTGRAISEAYKERILALATKQAREVIDNDQ